MKKQDIVFGSFLLLIVLVTYFYFKNESNLNVPVEPVPTVSLDEKVEGRFDTKLPENVEKTELKPLTLGSSFAATTREYVNGQFTLTILADLPDPEPGQFYQAWITVGDSQKLSLGQLREAKGGWLLEYQSNIDYTKNNEVEVTLESKLDATPEEVLLRGSF